MTSARLHGKPADAAAVAAFADKVRRALGSDILKLSLFGSKVARRDSSDSDIDIPVMVEDARTAVQDQTDYADLGTVTTEEAVGIRREVEALIQAYACVFYEIATRRDD